MAAERLFMRMWSSLEAPGVDFVIRSNSCLLYTSIILEASKGAIAGTGAGLLVTAASNGLIDSTGNAIEKIN